MTFRAEKTPGAGEPAPERAAALIMAAPGPPTHLAEIPVPGLPIAVHEAAPAPAPTTGSERLMTRSFGLVMVGSAGAWLAHSMALWAVAPFLAALGFDAALGGLGLAVIAVSALLSRLVVGPRIDRGGSRAPAVAGTALLCLGGLGYAAAGLAADGTVAGLALAALGAALQGVGFGAMTTSSFAIVGDVAPAPRRGEAMGYFSASQPIVQGLGATLSFALVAAGGFGLLYGAIAAVAALSALMFAGLRKGGARTADLVRAPRTGQVQRAIAIPVIACGSLAFVGGALVLTVPLVGFAVGIDNPGVFYLAAAVSGVLGRLAMGRLSDRWGRAQVAVPGLLLLAVSVVALVGGADAGLAVFLAAGALYGIAAAAALPALQALVFDRSPASRRGTSAAAMGMAFDIGFGVGSILIGMVVGLGGATAGLLAAAATPVIASGLVVVDARAARRVEA